MIYLDYAATSLHKPEVVARAVYQALHQGLGNSGRGVNTSSLEAASQIYLTRVKLARLFHLPKAENIVFTQNSTEALNIAILGTIPEGGHVISTDSEHNSVLRPLYHLAKTRRVSLDFLPANRQGKLDYAYLDKFLRPETCAVVVNHASNVTGNVNDLPRLAEFARRHHLLIIVDASQTAGALPIDMADLDLDIVCFTGHKSLYGPQGTGGLAVKAGVEITPYKFGGTGVQSYNPDQPAEMPTRLEAGTLNGHSIAGLAAALDWIEATGMETIHQHEMELMHHFYESLREAKGLSFYGDYSPACRAPIVALNVLDYDAATVADYLSQHFDIATRAGAHCAPRMHRALGTENRGAVRFSFGYFTTREEVDQAIDAIRSLLT